MNIQNCQYVTNINNQNIMIKATIDNVASFVPLELKPQTLIKAIQEWVAKGNTIQEAD